MLKLFLYASRPIDNAPQVFENADDYLQHTYELLSHARRGPQAWRILRPSTDKPAVETFRISVAASMTVNLLPP